MSKKSTKRRFWKSCLIFTFCLFGLLIAIPVIFVAVPWPGTALTVEQFMERIDAAAGESPRDRNWRSPPLARLSKSEVNEVADILRKRYPFESLEDRMAYLAKLKSESHSTRSVVSDGTLQRLDKTELSTFWQLRRTTALKQLHSDEVDGFINESGFGIYRMPPVSAFSLEYSAPAQPLDPITVTSEYLSAPKIEIQKHTSSDNYPRQKHVLDETGAPWMESLTLFHQQSSNEFASSDQNGLFESVDRVAGFEPHVMYSPGWNGDLNPYWKINRLELVSLVVHDDPVVYLSSNLPRMDELDEHETRPLNAFETESLEQLFGGEDLAINANVNRVEMLGAVRAKKTVSIATK